MKTVDDILKGLDADIQNSKRAIAMMTPNAYLNGDRITAEQAKLQFAINLSHWIRS